MNTSYYITFLIVFLCCTGAGATQTFPMLNQAGEPSEELMETLLYPGEFKERRFTYISEGDEALFCLDSSLSAQRPFAQVYPERIVWPDIGGVDLVVDKLHLKLQPEGEWVTDSELEKGFAIRWFLKAIGQDFSNAPVFRMRAVGAEVFSTVDARVLMSWAEPRKKDICKDVKKGTTFCHLGGISMETQALDISPDATLAALAITGLKPRIEIYSLKREPELLWQSIFSTSSGGAREVAFSMDGEYIAALLANGEIHRFSADSGEKHMTVPSQGSVASSVWPGRTVAVAGKGGEITLWRLADGTIEWHVQKRRSWGEVDEIAVSGNGKRIAVLEYRTDSTDLRVFDIYKESPLLVLSLEGTSYVDLALDGEGALLFLSHRKLGLHFLKTESQMKPSPFGEPGEICTGRIEWIHGFGGISCSENGRILHFRQNGKSQKELQTIIESRQWLTAVSPGGETTVAAGSGNLLIWREND